MDNSSDDLSLGAAVTSGVLSGHVIMSPDDAAVIRKLFEDYIRLYSTRNDLLTAWFSENFSGFTGGGDFLVKSKDAWVDITRLDFSQVKETIRIEMKDLSLQALTPDVAVTTGFFVIHLPIEDHVLSRETARLVLIFRRESEGWKIVHSSISIPYQSVGAGEVYPLKDLKERNRLLVDLAAHRTSELSTANERLSQANVSLVREIAERKQAEEAMQRSETLYRSILMASPDDITITDAQGRIIMVSPVSWRMFRCLNVDQFVGHSMIEFIVPEDRPRVAENMERRMKGLLTGPSEYRALRFDGTTFDIEANTEFIRDAGGVPTGMIIIARDITERKLAEAEKARLEKLNRQLQKNESLARMAGAIAHLFNNELQAVLMGLEFALHDQPSDTPAIANLRLALASATKASEIGTLMLSYLGQTRPKRIPVNLTEVCSQSLSLLQEECPRGTSFRTSFESPGPVILADTCQLQMVLGKLVCNAAEATSGPQPEVRICVSTTPADSIPHHYRFPLDWQVTEQAYACLEVSDSGCGICPDTMDKIFDPFFSSKFPGRGMGLAVVLGIVGSFDGAVTVESEVGKGSRFRLYFPLTSTPVD